MTRYVAFAVAVAFAGLIGLVDVVTGYEINLGLFYLLPIALATWQTGPAAGLLLSVASVVGMFVIDNILTRNIPFPSHDLIPYWNATIRLGYFVVVTVILDGLRRAHERERVLARTDQMTGIANSQVFYDAARREIERARRYGLPFTVAYLDCDNFKEVNDRFGHHTGDDLLRIIARTMQDHLRAADLVARLGGDEFGILLPDTATAPARAAIRHVTDGLLAEMGGRQWPVTFSIGIVTFLTPPDEPDTAIRISDRLMYVVKKGGRNRVLHQVFDAASYVGEAD